MAYRFMAYLALRHDVDVDDGNALLRLYSGLVGSSESSQKLFDESRRHADALRSREVSKAVSSVSRRPELRAVITDLIRSWASAARGSVIEGRDIGTVVLPSANLKFFLTAAPDVRARRRWKNETGADYQEVLDDILRRDAADSSRAASPLKPADDSVIIDTSDLSVRQVLSHMRQRCDEVGLSQITNGGLSVE